MTTWSQWERLIGKGLVLSRDVKAAARGRLVKRLANRLIGRGLAWLGRRLWR